MKRLNARGTVVGIAAAAVAAGAAAAGAAAAGAVPVAAGAGSTNLVGTFKIARGSYAKGKAGGSYLRMIVPAGGGYFQNPDSRAPDKSYTLIDPGRDGGLATGRYQPSPTPAFDAKGNARVDKIMRPQSFDAINFSVASLPKNPQTGHSDPPPAIRLTGRALSGQVLAMTAEWNGQYFAQGSSAITGRYNPATHAFLLTWTSRIVGGPFNGFSGYWHLKGTFVPG
jgi:hypothetical protein